MRRDSCDILDKAQQLLKKDLLFIDYETRCEANIDRGAMEYCRHSSFEVICVAWSEDNCASIEADYTLPDRIVEKNESR